MWPSNWSISQNSIAPVRQRQKRQQIVSCLTALPPDVSKAQACRPLNVPRHCFYPDCWHRRRAAGPVPRLQAKAPNQVWTWDISKLPLTTLGTYLSLYVILDLYSRFTLTWMVSSKENSALAQQLVGEASTRYRIEAAKLTLHQDRGLPMIEHSFLDQPLSNASAIILDELP